MLVFDGVALVESLGCFTCNMDEFGHMCLLALLHNVRRQQWLATLCTQCAQRLHEWFSTPLLLCAVTPSGFPPKASHPASYATEKLL